MRDLDEIKRVLESMSPEELVAFRIWYQEFDAELWDRQIEEDLAAGKLGSVADTAIRDLHEGRCTEL